MRDMSYSAQRIQDILSLARLRILGDQLKKRSKKAYKVFRGKRVLLNGCLRPNCTHKADWFAYRSLSVPFSPKQARLGSRL